MSTYIKGLNHINLQVRDLDVARAWFVDTLELAECGRVPGKFFVLAGTDVIAIEQREDLPYSFDHYGLEARSREGMDALYSVLAARDIECVCHPHERRGGYSMTFRDPCGHIAEIQSYDASAHELTGDRYRGLAEDPEDDGVR